MSLLYVSRMYTDTISIVGSKKRGRKPLPLEEKRTSNLKAYHREYYKKQPLEYLCKENKRRKSVAVKQQYIIDDDVAEIFKNDLGNIVRIHELINDLEKGSWEQYLENRHLYQFEKKKNLIVD